ncbi:MULTISPECIES: alpha/beta hydrolase [unclassified Sinorhizobium]|uniref:alpha/beta hydrolase n=1 Tax=unclassified Sinorhizobium TaxID=2613772 RepID=UPI0024C24BC4|nr:MULTISPECIES: alpha/beta hydrolase [unclassified Sinorhizobium]MDK1375459.1 alpha/beta hydrolase [Sinorhizobium sp. 6-70]MDK1481829.1 alpha/beta hydrolase [Sinorhizobium sp. 6-117]
MTATKLLLMLSLMAAFAYMSVVGLTYMSQRTILYPGASRTPTLEPASWGESVSIRTPDGETLHGRYSRGEPGKASVLFFLGNADRIDNYDFLAEALASRGIGLLAISYRGYPGSTGMPSEAGLLIDGLAAFDWLAGKSGSEIVVLGQSLGSGVAVNTARKRPASAAILVSAYLSVLSLAQAHYPFFPVSLLLKDPFRSDLRIAEVRQPKLFIHGRSDAIIPLSSGEALYAIASEPKQMLIYDGSGHNDLWDARMVGDIVRFVEALQ